VAHGRRAVRQVLRGFVTRRAEAMLYESAEAALLAVEDVLQGPAFWRAHMDLGERRRKLAELTSVEKTRPLDPAVIAQARTRRLPRRLAIRVAYHLTGRGRLLPGALIEPRPALARKGVPASRYALFRFRQVIYLSGSGHSGFIARHDAARLAAIRQRTRQLQQVLSERFETLSATYRTGYAELTSKAYWQAVYA
jgi:galactofuranosylgalactofuranosylrhamnosyl-N-acetylglucosaminyl-diphospho-decaprenol beta-1,5/1,6-galactofuranosyltransferase